MSCRNRLRSEDLISYANNRIRTSDGLMTRYTFAGSEYFRRMQDRGLYTTDSEAVRKRIKKYDLENIYKEPDYIKPRALVACIPLPFENTWTQRPLIFQSQNTDIRPLYF